MHSPELHWNWSLLQWDALPRIALELVTAAASTRAIFPLLRNLPINNLYIFIGLVQCTLSWTPIIGIIIWCSTAPLLLAIPEPGLVKTVRRVTTRNLRTTTAISPFIRDLPIHSLDILIRLIYPTPGWAPSRLEII